MIQFYVTLSPYLLVSRILYLSTSVLGVLIDSVGTTVHNLFYFLRNFYRREIKKKKKPGIYFTFITTFDYLSSKRKKSSYPRCVTFIFSEGRGDNKCSVYYDTDPFQSVRLEPLFHKLWPITPYGIHDFLFIFVVGGFLTLIIGVITSYHPTQ